MVLKDINFNTAPFWVQFHGLPLEAFDVERATILGNAVGQVLMVESPEMEGKLLRSYVRTRVLVDLMKPLISEFLVPREDKEPALVSVRYERLQNFCYGCGMIGHDMKGCRRSREADEDLAKTYGPWLGTSQVKTNEDSLVVCREDWIEAKWWKKDQSEKEMLRRRGGLTTSMAFMENPNLEADSMENDSHQ